MHLLTSPVPLEGNRLSALKKIGGIAKHREQTVKDVQKQTRCSKVIPELEIVTVRKGLSENAIQVAEKKAKLKYPSRRPQRRGRSRIIGAMSQLKQ